MGKKCCVPECRSNYDPKKTKKKKKEDEKDGDEGEDKENVKPPESKHVPVFRFPLSMDEKLRWIASIPKIKKEKVLAQKEPVVCIKHWPPGFPTHEVHGKCRPSNPPSVFNKFAKSVIPTPPPKPRPTSRFSAEVRTRQEDELKTFKENDRLTWESLQANLSLKSRQLLCIQ